MNRGVRLRVWLRRRRVWVAAAIAGVIGFAGTLGGGEVNLGTIISAVLIGVLTPATVILVDGFKNAIESAPDRSSIRPLPVAPKRGALPAMLPPERLSTFRGRVEDLNTLLRIHENERRLRDSPVERSPTTSPILLLIHGKPGVGKSAVARELARQLTDSYPDGVFHANFGSGGRPKPPAEILSSFLLSLNWPEAEMPGDAQDRASLLRSLTANKRILFVFDAARHHDQVMDVLPSDPGCAVIVTSRRDLGPALNVFSVLLDTPPIGDALEILAAVAQAPWQTCAEQAIEVVDLCGRLPVAIKSAAERVSLDGTDLRHVADLLRPTAERLSWLQRGGRGVKELFLSEYQRLSSLQQRALGLLAMLDSPTFVPWVLCPLVEVGDHEAASVMATLAAAQLLDDAGYDKSTDLPRYRFNPVVKLFATSMSAGDNHAKYARARLDDAYLELIDAVLRHVDEGYETERDDPIWVADTSPVPRRVAEYLEDAIRAEYGNLVRAVSVAHDRKRHALCWRVAASLHGCVPAGSESFDVMDAFEVAEESARRDNSTLGEIDVQFAKGAYLVAIEDYAEAFAVLDRASQQVDALESSSAADATDARRRRARICRKRAEAFLQMGAYRDAAHKLTTAAELANDPEEVRLIGLLQAENHRVPSPDLSYGDILEGELNDPIYFRAQLCLSEVDRRRGYWASAEDHLLTAERHSNGDARRTAATQYRLGRLYIDQWRHTAPGHGLPRARKATLAMPAGMASSRARRSSASQSQDPARISDRGVTDIASAALRHSAEATIAFRRMGNLVGIVRAQCQQIRALVIANRLIEAEQLTYTVWKALMTPELLASPAREHLLARFARAYGELLVHRGDWRAGWRVLAIAATTYADNNDWACHREIWTLLNAFSPTPSGLSDSLLEETLISSLARQESRSTRDSVIVSVPRPRKTIDSQRSYSDEEHP